MKIDINADVGESFGHYQLGSDEELFKVITSANVACGFHAGDFRVMNHTIKIAKENNISIGAHPGYPDLQGFGRREMNMSPEEVYELVVYQLGALHAFCKVNQVRINHVKPHGALYNTASKDRETADAIAHAVKDIFPHATLYGLCNGELIEAGNSVGIKTAAEAFADRRYDEKGFLVSRSIADSVISDLEQIVQQVENIVINRRVLTVNKTYIPIEADTLCFHGDGMNVASIVEQVRNRLVEMNVSIQSLELVT